MKVFGISSLSHTIVAYLLFLSIIMLFIGCSKKNNEKISNNSDPCRAANAADACSAPSADGNNLPHPAPPADGNDPNKATTAVGLTSEEPVVSDVLSELSYLHTSSERKVELLESLAGLAADQDPNILAAVQKGLEDPNAEVAQAALDLLDGYEDPNILPAVETALQHNDESIRENAVQFLGNVDAPQVGDLIAQAFNDASEDVRSAAITAAEGLNEDIQLAVSQIAIASPYADAKEAAVSMLENMGNKKSVDVLINGLKDQNSDFRQTVSGSLESLIDQKFNTFEQAQSWWKKNKNKFDDDLDPIGDK
jgi:hypothetical protein